MRIAWRGWCEGVSCVFGAPVLSRVGTARNRSERAKRPEAFGPFGTLSFTHMESTSPPSPDFSKLSQFNRDGIAFGKQLEQESDRGAALTGLAFLDELLKRLFE